MKSNPIVREFGLSTLNVQPSSLDFIERLLKLILDMDDPERAFVPVSPSDVYLLVNNMGGTSTLEMYAIADETLSQLTK